MSIYLNIYILSEFLMKNYRIYLIIALAISLIFNLAFLLKMSGSNASQDLTKCELDHDSNLEPSKVSKTQKREVEVPLFSVYIKPHPPDFLEGRKLFFKDYTIENKDGKTFVVFTESNNNSFSKTVVDSEAIVWK